MADMIRSAAEWFESKRLLHLTVPATYRAANSMIDHDIDATLSTENRTVVDSSGQFITIQTRSFVIAVSQYSATPKRDDRITVTEGGISRTYVVASPTPNDAVWVWADRANLTRKVFAVPA